MSAFRAFCEEPGCYCLDHTEELVVRFLTGEVYYCVPHAVAHAVEDDCLRVPEDDRDVERLAGWVRTLHDVFDLAPFQLPGLAGIDTDTRVTASAVAFAYRALQRQAPKVARA